MALIDRYIAEQKKIDAQKISFWKYVWVVFYTLGGMATDQIKPNDQKPGILGHAPMPYSALFFILFVFFMIGSVFISAIL